MNPGWRIRRLHDGSSQLARRTGRAFVPLDQDGEIRLIASGIRITAGVALSNGLLNLAHQSPIWLVGGTSAWCWAAWRAGSPEQPTEQDTTDTAEPRISEDESEQAPVATDPTPADARRAVAVLGAAGTHVALTAVTAHLAAKHPLWKRSGKAVRALLREAGVEVRGGVRVEGVSVPGIHHDDVPPLPSLSESAPGRVVVAGQSNNNNANNAEEWVGEKGFIMRAHPDHPDRTIIVGRTNAA